MIKLICCAAIASIFCYSAHADTGALSLSLPGQTGSYQADSFRSDGADCSMAIGSSTNVEFGVLGLINKDPGTTISSSSTGQVRDVGVYARITIPIGAPKQRLDCNEFYQLELRKRQIELLRLERELQNLKNLRFENNASTGNNK